MGSRISCGLLPLFGLLFGFILMPALPSPAEPQPLKYWIFLTDKNGAAAQPHGKSSDAYVAAEALERRRLRGTRVDPEDDVPVSAEYIERLGELGVEPVVTSRWFNAVSAYLDEDQLEAIRGLSFVREIQPVGERITPPNRFSQTSDASANAYPAVPSGTRRLEYGASRLQLAMINAISPLEQEFNGEGVILGFLDTQFDFDHPALRHVQQEGRLIDTRDFTGPLVDSTGIANDNYHGLSVTSVAIGHDPGSLIGPGHKASILGATTEYVPRERNQEEDFFIAGMEWLEREGVDVVNVSLGYTTFDPGEESYTYEDMDGNTALSTRAADRAVSKGVVVVASAGNQGCRSPENCWYYVGAPADGDSVITVGAARPDSSRAAFSSLGPTPDDRIKPDVAALGTTIRRNDTRRGIYVAVPSDGDPYTYSAGTSFASPLVAGVVTQMLQANPLLTPMDVREVLRSTASQAAQPDNSLGWGIVNAGAAVNQVRELVYPDEPSLIASHPNPFLNATTMTVTMPAEQSEQARLALYDMLGRKVAEPFSGTLDPGPNAISIDGTNLPPGIYLYRLVSNTFTETGTITRLR